MGKYTLTFALLISVCFGVQPFTAWWERSSEVCITGSFKDFSGRVRKIKPFCCKVHRVEIKNTPKFLKVKGIKESIVVVASCRGSFFGIINYDGGIYAVNGKVGISKDTPIGVIRVLNDKRAYFEVCQGSADFTRGCLSEPLGKGYIIRVSSLKD